MAEELLNYCLLYKINPEAKAMAITVYGNVEDFVDIMYGDLKKAFLSSIASNGYKVVGRINCQYLPEVPYGDHPLLGAGCKLTVKVRRQNGLPK